MRKFASFKSRSVPGVEGVEGEDKTDVFLTKKCLLPRTAKASNLARGWNVTWDGQAGLGHPPWERGGRGHEQTSFQKGGGGV